MSKVYVFLCVCFCSGSSCIINQVSLECKVEVTKEYVFFDHCYNGLFINELETQDSNITLYPHNFKRISKCELWAIDSFTQRDKINLKLFFNKHNDHFMWKIFHCEDYDPMRCFSDGNNFELKDTINLFKPNRWYLFFFANPHFEVFVYCDSIGKVSFVKRDLNTNF